MTKHKGSEFRACLQHSGRARAAADKGYLSKHSRK